MSSNIVIKNQWDDFLIRETDPYANAKYEIILSWLPLLKGQRVLVVGSGSGELVVMLANRGAEVTAIDISSEYVELTVQAAARAGLTNITCQVSRLENFESSLKFDLVIATDVLEHIEKDQEAVIQCLSHLNEGGLFLVTVPSLQFLFGYHDEILGHFRRYNKSSLMNLVPVGIEEVQLRYFGFFLIPVAFVVSRLLRISYPVQSVGQQQNKNSFFGFILGLLFKIEKKFALPLGTSLLFLGKK